ncbi:hypothetical protein RUM44_009874 [Polyplax serrata]|uniref:Uncharacterized protein n=1 Tax=Polyplax serrata TaxID=468196 RepID=A0ABR1AU11_POLSC
MEADEQNDSGGEGAIKKYGGCFATLCGTFSARYLPSRLKMELTQGVGLTSRKPPSPSIPSWVTSETAKRQARGGSGYISIVEHPSHINTKSNDKSR